MLHNKEPAVIYCIIEPFPLSLILYIHCSLAAAQLHCQLSGHKGKENMVNLVLDLKTSIQE